MFHYYKIPYFTCNFFTRFTYNEYIGPYFFYRTLFYDFCPVISLGFNLLCVGCKLYLYLQDSLSYTKHVRNFKLAENNEIRVLLEISSHGLYSHEEIQRFRFNRYYRMSLRKCKFQIFNLFLLNDIVTKPGVRRGLSPGMCTCGNIRVMSSLIHFTCSPLNSNFKT
jgi:hypothetical protein